MAALSRQHCAIKFLQISEPEIAYQRREKVGEPVAGRSLEDKNGVPDRTFQHAIVPNTATSTPLLDTYTNRYSSLACSITCVMNVSCCSLCFLRP